MNQTAGLLIGDPSGVSLESCNATIDTLGNFQMYEGSFQDLIGEESLIQGKGFGGKVPYHYLYTSIPEDLDSFSTNSRVRIQRTDKYPGNSAAKDQLGTGS